MSENHLVPAKAVFTGRKSLLWALFSLGLVHVLDRNTPSYITMNAFYTVPVMIAAWGMGRSGAFAIALLATSSWVYVSFVVTGPFTSTTSLTWTSLSWFAGFIIPGLIVDVLKRRMESERALRLSAEGTETKLLESVAVLSLFVRHSPIYTYIKEVTPTESRILEASDNFEQMIGIKGSEMVGKTMAEVFPAELAAKTLVDDLAVVSSGKTLEVEEELNGRSYTTLKFPIVQGGRTLLAGFTIDITEQKKTKEALAAQSTALAAVIDNNPMSIQILDREGRTIRTNPAFLTLFGATPPPAYSMFSDPTLAAQGLIPVFDQIRAGEVVYFPETSYNVHDVFPEYPDLPVWVRTLGFPILGAEGRPERFVLMHEDVSQRRKAEQARAELRTQLQQSQKMESLGTLAGGVAHDMNNVLGAILGLASAHIDTQSYGSPLHKALDTIIKATERGGKMVKSLLNFARQNPAENHELDLNSLLREQAALMERTTLAKVSLQLDLEANLRPIQGDAGALTHAFMNLCVNAVDAMPVNGTLTLRTRNVDNDSIEVVVEDTGTGMPKEVLEKAMDPFFTTKETGKGTGLGLAMVFSTVKAHRGQMTLQSELGQGTRVLLRFPACEKETQVEASAVFEEAGTPHVAMKVLLVDDDDLIQSSVQAILEVLGHTAVTPAQSGEEALALLEAGFEPDLVILDMTMPGLGGAETLPRLRGLRPVVPVLLSTGRTDQTALNLASMHPGVTLLPKPFGMKELQKHLESIGLG
jgi:PAS domain S-box-containing protein